MPSLQFEAGYEAGYRDGIGIVSPWAQILIALGGLRDQMPVDEVVAVQRFAERLKDRRRDSDGTATAAANGDLPVPQDCQARVRRTSPNSPPTNTPTHEGDVE
jgi:hypothetical protein